MELQYTKDELSIKPSGSKTYDSWFSGEQFVGGFILMNFSGEDVGGHPVKIQVKINCK